MQHPPVQALRQFWRSRLHRWLPRSLRWRLLLGTLLGITLALLLAGLGLGSLFREHVLEQFRISLVQQLDQVTARFSVDAQGRPLLAAQQLSDPRWQQPYSGLYWQIDEILPDGARRNAVLRSRSLWDGVLPAPHDALVGSDIHMHTLQGPKGPVLLLERVVRDDLAPGSAWRLMVAADLRDTAEAIDRFERLLAWALCGLLLLLLLAAWAQVALGLHPLRRLQRGLQAVQNGTATTLQGEFPVEVQPLVDDFNRVLAHNQAVVERARTHAGNLAHALKTPLSVIDQLAAQAVAQAATQNTQNEKDPQEPRDPAGSPAAANFAQMREQVQVARRHIDWHLKHARMAAGQRLGEQRCDVAVAVQSLLRVMERLYAERQLRLHWLGTSPAKGAPMRGDALLGNQTPALWFAGEEQDLQEMLGNLLDNACKWARSQVWVRAWALPSPSPSPSSSTNEASAAGGEGSQAAMLTIEIQDDGVGIDVAQLNRVTARGIRLDESVPGTGLGLAIVQELAGLYGGRLALRSTAAGGLCATLTLPMAR